MAHPILMQVQEFLSYVGRGNPVDISPDIIDQFGKACAAAFRKQFVEPRQNKFTLRMSNIGKPLCQLQMERDGAPFDLPSYDRIMSNLYGDLIEAAALAVMKSAGVKIQAESERVNVSLGGINLEGTLDVIIDNKVWDVKSASPSSFTYKFGEFGGFQALVEDDNFGYIGQGYSYALAKGLPFGGWIVVNKGTGEWAVVEAPTVNTPHMEDAIAKVDDTIRAITENRPFARCFTDEPEKWYGKPTGNKILAKACSYCQYKKPCWPGVEQRRNPRSDAKVPKKFWYTQFNEEKGKVNDSDSDGSTDTAPTGN